MWACDPTLTATIVDSYQVAGPLFVAALQAFFAAHCALVGDHLWPVDATDSVLKDPSYDFIVVGAGTAGSVLANRLTEVEDWKVLLIEAGGNPNLITETPQLFFAGIDSSVDWGYKTQPEDSACRSYRSKGCAWPRGKVLGGCSSINGMFYVRGNKLDYDEWAAEGNQGWSYKEVLPYFLKSENFSGTLDSEEAKYHGTGGYLHIEHSDNVHDLEKLILKANEELGLKILKDINGANQMGITRSLSNTKDGVRHSMARAFLSPIKDRPNLHVLKNAQVTKLVFKENTKIVTGVLVNKNGQNFVVNAKKEVIVSAGSINTPSLLMHSGIGPKRELEKHLIDVKVDLPVGENLQDHALVTILYKKKSDMSLFTTAHITHYLADFINNQRGPLSDVSPHKIIAFINTTDPTSSSPDIQNHYITFPPNISNILDVFGRHGLSDEFNEKFKIINKDHAVLIPYSVLLKPKSKGKVVLKSANPLDLPLIYANYFDDPEDMKTIIRGIRHIMKLGETSAFKNAGFELEWIELEACKNFKKETDEYLECLTRETTMSLYHPVGTAKMGPKSDPTAVVDPTLKVHGVENLRVIDASIMPNIPRGNTNAPTIMIAEKGADLIKASWQNYKHSEL